MFGQTCTKHVAACMILFGPGLMLRTSSTELRAVNGDTYSTSPARWGYLGQADEQTGGDHPFDGKWSGSFEASVIGLAKPLRYGVVVLVLLIAFFGGGAVSRGLLRRRYTKRIRQLEREFAQHRRDDEGLERIGEIRDGSPSPFLRISRDGTFLYHNKAAVPLLKVWRYWKALPQSSPWFHYIAEALDSGQPRRGEVTCGGRVFSLTFAPVVDSGYVDVHGLDITAHKVAEDKLRERGEQFWAIAGYSYDLEGWHGLDGQLAWINPAVKRITGYSMSECMAMADYPLPMVHQDDREDVGKVIHQFIKERTSGSNLPFRICRKDGELVWVVMSWQPIYNARGLYKGIRSSIHDITERKHKQDQIVKQSAVINGINRVLQEALTCETEAEVACTCLSVAEELTGSKFGLIGEVNKAGLFDTIAISNPGWSACKMPGSEATRLIKGMEIRGIWSRVLKDEESQIVNDPLLHPDRVGTPKGHPAVSCFLGVPLKEGDRTIGLIGLANKDSGYEESDREAIESLSIAFVQALMRKRAEKKISRG